MVRPGERPRLGAAATGAFSAVRGLARACTPSSAQEVWPGTIPPMGMNDSTGTPPDATPDHVSAAPTYRYGQHKDDYRARLRRIEGQVRGIARMVESDSYCIDVLTQITAVKRALEKVAVGLLDDHLRGCVTDAARDEDPRRADEIIAEATSAIERLVRS